MLCFLGLDCWLALIDLCFVTWLFLEFVFLVFVLLIFRFWFGFVVLTFVIYRLDAIPWFWWLICCVVGVWSLFACLFGLVDRGVDWLFFSWCLVVFDYLYLTWIWAFVCGCMFWVFWLYVVLCFLLCGFCVVFALLACLSWIVWLCLVYCLYFSVFDCLGVWMGVRLILVGFA